MIFFVGRGCVSFCEGRLGDVEGKSMYTIIYEHQKWKSGVHQ